MVVEVTFQLFRIPSLFARNASNQCPPLTNPHAGDVALPSKLPGIFRWKDAGHASGKSWPFKIAGDSGFTMESLGTWFCDASDKAGIFSRSLLDS
jgi:hypothetical protein